MTEGSSPVGSLRYIALLRCSLFLLLADFGSGVNGLGCVWKVLRGPEEGKPLQRASSKLLWQRPPVSRERSVGLPGSFFF